MPSATALDFLAGKMASLSGNWDGYFEQFGMKWPMSMYVGMHSSASGSDVQLGKFILLDLRGDGNGGWYHLLCAVDWGPSIMRALTCACSAVHACMPA
jgi:hypothetical protein